MSIRTTQPQSHLTEFPDYPASDFPALPSGFIDSSWVNDICPSMHHEERNLHIFCDYANPDERELGGPRFSLHSGDELDVIAESETWPEILAALAKFEGESA